MKKVLHLSYALLAAASLILSGCSKTERTLAGVAIGAGSGALIGGAAGGSGGALAGAGIGGLVGGVVGNASAK